MKSKLLPALLVILIVLNGVLIFMLIKKPHQKKQHHSEREFLTEQLQFSENQIEKYRNLDEIHRETMVDLDHKLRKQKDILFNSFGDESINVDSLIALNGNLEVKKEAEVFRFFKSVRKICNKEQQEKFDEIINKALKGGKPGPLKDGGKHHPQGDRMPPPKH